MRRRLIRLTIMAAALAAALQFAPMCASAEEAATIPQNVTICGTDVSGMTAEEAQAVVDAYIAQYDSVEFTLTAGEKSVIAKGSDLGLGEGSSNVVSKALNYGKSGNLLKRFRESKDIAGGNVKNYNIKITADSTAIQDFLTQNAGSLSDGVVNNGLKRENGQFVYVPGQAGVVVDKEASAARIQEYIANSWDGSNAAIELVTEMKEPEGSEEELSQITDVLGSYSTDFHTSSKARATNVKNGASKINGTVLYPGETLSVYETVSPFSAENGYALAGSYENGTTVETYGGGICQVSTTLYNAVMRAELEIVTRSAHSMVVSYVEPSMDAAISGTAKDFQFKNNQEYPVYIEGYTDGGWIYFNIYGKETRPAGHVVTFESEITSQTDPVTEYVPDATLPLGTISKLQGSHTGYTARLWKITTENGVETERKIYNRSTYKVSNAKYSVGTAGLTADQTNAIVNACATGDEATVRNTVATVQAETAQTQAVQNLIQ